MKEWMYSDDKKSILFPNYAFYRKSQDVVFKEDLNDVSLRNQEVLDYILEYNPKSILDIGCRDGQSYDIIKDKNIKWQGVDISPRCVNFINNENIIEGDAHFLSYVVEEKFDAIIMIHILEHCYDPNLVLQQCCKVLNDFGMIGIRVPVQKDLTKQKRLLK